MKHTSPGVLIVVAVVGAVVGFGLQAALAAASLAKLRPEYTFSLSLAIIAALVVVLAVPIRRAVRGSQPRPIDPFYATRVVMLAKATSLGGSLFAGAALGLLADLVLRGSPNGDTLGRIIAALTGGVVLLVAGLVAEFLCRVPPRDDDDDDRRDGHPERVRS